MIVDQGISFHDSSLIAVERSSKQSLLKFENVYVNGKLRFANILLEDIQEVICDGQIIEAIEIKYDDGEVLDLSSTDTTLSMNLQWVDYTERTEEFHSYKVECGSVSVVVGNLVP